MYVIQELLVWWLFSLFTAPIFHQESIKHHLMLLLFSALDLWLFKHFQLKRKFKSFSAWFAMPLQRKPLSTGNISCADVEHAEKWSNFCCLRPGLRGDQKASTGRAIQSWIRCRNQAVHLSQRPGPGGCFELEFCCLMEEFVLRLPSAGCGIDSQQKNP